MPTYRYVAVGPDGSEIKDALDAPSEDALRNELLMRNLEVKQVKQKKSFNELELSPQRVPKPGDHALLAADGRVRAHRHSDHRGARGGGGRVAEQAVPADPRDDARADQQRCAVLRRARRALEDLPAVLRRDPEVGRAHRSARRLARTALGIHRARPRLQEQDQGRHDLPAGDRGHVADDRRDPLGVGACRSSSCSSRTSTRSCRCRRCS